MTKNLILIALLLAAMATGCSQREEEGKEAQKKPPHKQTVHLNEESQRIIGLALVEAKKEPLLSSFEVTGEVAKEAETVFHATSPQEGIVKEIRVGLGKPVEKDDVLCVVEAQGGKPIEICSPGRGIVLAHYVKRGDKVENLSSILAVANMDTLRTNFDVYEKDLGKIQVGQEVVVSSLAYPDKEFDGKIVFVSPEVDQKTRTIKIRVNVQNDEHLLKFGMFVTGKISISMGVEALVIPEEAIVEIEGLTAVFLPQTGEKEEFLIRPVQIGRTMGGKTEILLGLTQGDKVVGKGSFYLKAELRKDELEQE